MKPPTIPYKLSFTAAPLLLQESVKLAELFLEFKEWEVVRDHVLSKNLLQARTQSSLKRICQEIIPRLENLNQEELELLVQGSSQEQAQLLWVAVCRRYRFIAEFAVEVLRERYLTLKGDVQLVDYDSFFNQKSEWHPELENLSASTRNKLRQVLFRIMREADLLTKNNTINAVMLSPRVMDILIQDNPRDLTFFPMPDNV
ncbi:DUF1819 family protein [Desulfonatronum parangueonense]